MRHRYGGTMDAYAIGEDTTSVPGATLAVLRAGAPVTFWTTKTGGVQYNHAARPRRQHRYLHHVRRWRAVAGVRRAGRDRPVGRCGLTGRG
jgi:hypothetical protein